MSNWIDELHATLNGPTIPADAITITDLMADPDHQLCRQQTKIKMDALVKSGAYLSATGRQQGRSTTFYWPKPKEKK